MIKYLVILVGIIATVVYVFVEGGSTGRRDKVSAPDRCYEVVTSIRRLEAKRQDLLLRARMDAAAYSRAPAHPRGGAYAAGYREGFAQGYAVGSYLSETRTPNPLFFPVPNAF